jgi:hypothetical protein
VTGARHVQHLELALPDRAVQVRVDEGQPRGRAPVTESVASRARARAARAGAGCRAGRSDRPRGSSPRAHSASTSRSSFVGRYVAAVLLMRRAPSPVADLGHPPAERADGGVVAADLPREIE